MREYVESLDTIGALKRVSMPVDPKFELAAITHQAQKKTDAAILFENVKGSSFPIVTNVFGSRDRLCRLVGAEDGNFCKAWTSLMEARQPGNDNPNITKLPMQKGNLDDLPQITYFERDGGPYITAGIFLAKDPETGTKNLSFHRAMYAGPNELRICLGASHDLTRYFATAEKMNQPLEAAILLGPPPEVFLAACASLPLAEDEIEAAAKIAGSPIPMQPCRNIDLSVPLGTQIVIEGAILPGIRRPEGPFGEFMGYYVPQSEKPVFEVSGVYWQNDAVFHSLNCGSPEDIYPLDYAVATRIYQALREKLPGIIDVACYPRLMNTVVQIHQEYDGHAKHVLLAALAAHMDYSKSCMVIDEDINIRDLDEIMWAYLTRGRADTRAFILNDMPGFYRDPHKDHWGRLAIDATKPFDRQHEFERKRIPNAENIQLSDYFRVD